VVRLRKKAKDDGNFQVLYTSKQSRNEIKPSLSVWFIPKLNTRLKSPFLWGRIEGKNYAKRELNLSVFLKKSFLASCWLYLVFGSVLTYKWNYLLRLLYLQFLLLPSSFVCLDSFLLSFFTVFHFILYFLRPKLLILASLTLHTLHTIRRRRLCAKEKVSLFTFIPYENLSGEHNKKCTYTTLTYLALQNKRTS